MPFFRTEQDPLLVALLTTTPPSLLWRGREAVLLFFVLSGFVLAQAFLRGGPQPWLPFVARRACRLMLPCIAVALPVAALVAAIDTTPRPGWSDWTAGHWSGGVTPRMAVSHALLIEQPYALNSPLWSLHYEWRISLLFPLLVLLAAAGPATAMAASLALAVLGQAELRFLGSDWLSALVFLPHFMLGVLMAREGARLPARIAALSPHARLGLWALCYLLLTWRWLVPSPNLAVDLLNGAGAALLIALVLASPRVQAALAWRPVAWLGMVSFSLYLVHVPVILAALHLAPAEAPMAAVLAAAVLVSLPVAWAFFHLAERPSIWLGRAVSRRLAAVPAGRAAA